MRRAQIRRERIWTRPRRVRRVRCRKHLIHLIPFEIGMTLDKALEEAEELKKVYDEDEEVRALIDMGRKLEGLARNAGKHAGGVVISPGLLTDFTPLYCEAGSEQIVTQFDKDDVEAVGLVKFDFLGLRTLTIVDWALRTINETCAKKGEPPVEIEQIPIDDEASFRLLKACETTAYERTGAGSWANRAPSRRPSRLLCGPGDRGLDY